MQRWKFNYRLFFKKNITGLVAVVIFGMSAANWDNGLLLKTVAMAEVMPDSKISMNSIVEIHNEEKEIVVSREKKEGKKKDKKKEKDTEKNKIDPGSLFILNEEEKNNFINTDYMRKCFYIVDSRTDILENELNGVEFLNSDFSINNKSEGPKILIFHTHSHEGFIDSNMAIGKEEGIVGTGERLKEILENDYGIETMHCTESFDYVDSKMTITGSYERMEPVIQKILQENPSIEIVLDLHRDGIGDESVKLVTEIDGKPTAQIMFFNGMCRVYENGNLIKTAGLDNQYLKDNLAFSFAMKYAGDKMYPGFVRKNYINAYRYSLHMRPKSLLVEVGAQTNTKEEAYNAMEPLAEMLVSVINKNNA